MKTMVELLDPNRQIIPVDAWDTEQYPIAEEDRIFKNVRDEIILNITDFFHVDGDEHKQLNYFIMKAKRSYNSETTRFHICKYLNYFLKFYDYDKELLVVLYKIKVIIDSNKDYSVDNFMDDVNRYIILNPNLTHKIKRFVNDNYSMKLGSNGGKTPNLQFDDYHAKILYEISLIMNMYIPLATHYMFLHFIKERNDVRDFMCELFDMCCDKYIHRDFVDCYNKLWEIGTSVTNKSKSTDRILWEMNRIRGNNPTTHIKESIDDIILQLIPKYVYIENIISFNYYSSRKSLSYKITDASYEYQFAKMSSHKRDADENSEIDRYESTLRKKDESLYLQNKVSADEACKLIERLYGPFNDDEVEFYRRRLSNGNDSVKHYFQKELIYNMFYKIFGDPVTAKSISETNYIKLMIAAKRILINSGMTILPFILSGKVIRVASRKSMNKKETMEIKACDIWQQIVNIYNNPKVEQKVIEIIATIEASTFEIIEYDPETGKGDKDLNGVKVPIINDIIRQEVLIYITMI